MTEDNICELLGLDMNKTALEIVKADFKRKKIPFCKTPKHLSQNSSASKSVKKAASKLANKS